MCSLISFQGQLWVKESLGSLATAMYGMYKMFMLLRTQGHLITYLITLILYLIALILY